MTTTGAAWEERFRVPTLTLPTWAEDAPDRLIHVSDESGVLQAHAWDRAAGTRRQVTDEPVGVMLADITPDGSEVVWFSDDSGDESGHWVAEPFGGGERRRILDDAPAGWPEGLSLGRRVVAAALADREGFAAVVSDDRGSRVLFRDRDFVAIGSADAGFEGAGPAGLSPDEGAVCLMTAQDGDSLHCMLRVLDVATGKTIGELADGRGFGVSPVAWAPTGRRLLLTQEREDRSRPAIWDPASGERGDLALDLPGEVYALSWFPDGGSILAVHRYRGRDALLRIDVRTGGSVELVPPRGEIAGARVRPDGRVWFRELRSTRASRLLDDAGDEVLAPPAVGDPTGRPYRSWTFRNPAGDTVHGFVLVPPGPGPFPLYLKVHGGPSWLYGDTFHPDAQAIADLGFAVAIVNYRGSTGYGRRWRDHIIGNVGFPELEDVVAGTDDLIARGIADPTRVVLAGWSWGGYLGLLGAGTYPDRWKAVVAGVPVGDYVESYDESAPSLQAYDRALLGGSVHDLPELVAERSPITYLDRVRAPILALVGENDSRCPPAQALKYVEALRARGGDVELYTYATGHSSFETEESLRQWRVVLDFLRRKVLGS
ncbi:MAG: alpha/beta fold hydrolase [Actinomycetota bacterium]